MNKDYGFVYLLQCGNQYKIGYSCKPLKRVKQLRTGSSYPISLIHSIRTPFYQQIEKQLHQRFSEKRGEGEWFKLTDEDVDYICGLNRFGRTPEEQEQTEQERATQQITVIERQNAVYKAEVRAAMAVVAAV